MAFENEFYTVAFLKAFAKSAVEYADKESALLWKVTKEFSAEEAERFYDRLNEEASRIASEKDLAANVLCSI